MEIKFLDCDYIGKVALLSKQFESEGCCNKIVAADEDFLRNKKLVGCIVDNELVAYCYGEVVKECKKRSYADVGDLFFELEEIYVLPKFRDLKIGQKLFKFVESYAKGLCCKTIRLNAVSKDYKRLLNFYIDILGMEFISSYLIKNI